MNRREKELAHFGSQVRWLDQNEAADAYSEASRFLSKHSYALEQHQFDFIEKSNAEPCESALRWLKQRVRAGFLRVIFGRAEVCTVSSSFLLQHWQDMFTPARDDVLVVPQDASWVLYFSHEQEIQYGRRRA